MKAVIEGLIFLSGSDGISLDEIIAITEKDKEEISFIIKELYQECNNDNRGIQIELLGNRFKFTTKKEHKEYYQKLASNELKAPLSQSSLETLAIIAYNEPITRGQIDEIRGVNSSYIIRKLLLKDLIEERGRSELPGRPKQYGVTNNFLDYFGLNSTEELPSISKPNHIDDDTNLFLSKYTENNDDNKI